MRLGIRIELLEFLDIKWSLVPEPIHDDLLFFSESLHVLFLKVSFHTLIWLCQIINNQSSECKDTTKQIRLKLINEFY